MAPRSVGRVAAVFQSHSTRRTSRLFVRSAAAPVGDCCCIETIQLPETVGWRNKFRPCLLAAENPSLSSFSSLLVVLLSALRIERTLPLQKELEQSTATPLMLVMQYLWRFTRQTATVLAVSTWTSASAVCATVKGGINVRCHCRRGRHIVCMRRGYFSSWSQGPFIAIERTLPAVHMSQRHLTVEGSGRPEHNQYWIDGMRHGCVGMANLGASQLSRASWYARQVRRLLVDFDSLQYLCQDTEMQANHRHVAIVLGCIAALDSNSGWGIADVLSCLSMTDRVAAVATLLVSYRVFPADRLNDALAVVFYDRCATHEEGWVLLQAMIAAPDVVPLVHERWVEEVVGCVVRGCRDVEWRDRTVAALRLGERVLSAETLAVLCDESGLWYESAAYRSAATETLLETTIAPSPHNKKRIDNGCGFGDHMAVLLRALVKCDPTKPPPFGAIEALRREMSPACAMYTMHRVTAELTRNEWESGCGVLYGGDNSDGANMMTALQYLEKTMSLSREMLNMQASKLHFDMRLGAVSTAVALLPSCRHSWCGSVRVIQHTHRAGVAMALDVLRCLMELSPSARYYVVVRLQALRGRFCRKNNGGCHLLLEAKTTPEVLSKPDNVTLRTTGLWRRFTEIVSRQHLHDGHTLWSLPASCVPRLAATMPQLPSSLLSCWISLLLRHKRHDSVYAVMQVAAERGIVPEMETLVEVLESAYDNNDKSNSNNATAAAELQRGVRNVRHFFPDCAPVVFRAFVERAAGRMHETAPQEWNAALHLVSTMSVLGLLHYPRNCLESIASCAPTPVVFAMLQLLREDMEEAAVLCSSPAPLELHALRRLVCSAQNAGLRPAVDVIAVSHANKKTAWWSSEAATAGLPMATALYRQQVVGLWHHALQDVAWRVGGCVASGNRTEVHHAIRLASFGTDSLTTLLRGVMAAQKHQQRGQVASDRMRRPARAGDAMLVLTIACVAGALLARGRWEGALRIVPPGVTHLPPILRLVRLKALQCSDEFHEHATMLLESELRPIRRKRRRRCFLHGYHQYRRRHCRGGDNRGEGGGRMPDGVRRLVEKMQMRDQFRWWDERR